VSPSHDRRPSPEAPAFARVREPVVRLRDEPFFDRDVPFDSFSRRLEIVSTFFSASFSCFRFC
jgi:hypothetical protein